MKDIVSPARKVLNATDWNKILREFENVIDCSLFTLLNSFIRLRKPALRVKYIRNKNISDSNLEELEARMVVSYGRLLPNILLRALKNYLRHPEKYIPIKTVERAEDQVVGLSWSRAGVCGWEKKESKNYETNAMNSSSLQV